MAPTLLNHSLDDPHSLTQRVDELASSPPDTVEISTLLAVIRDLCESHASRTEELERELALLKARVEQQERRRTISRSETGLDDSSGEFTPKPLQLLSTPRRPSESIRRSSKQTLDGSFRTISASASLPCLNSRSVGSSHRNDTPDDASPQATIQSWRMVSIGGDRSQALSKSSLSESPSASSTSFPESFCDDDDSISSCPPSHGIRVGSTSTRPTRSNTGITTISSHSGGKTTQLTSPPRSAPIIRTATMPSDASPTKRRQSSSYPALISRLEAVQKSLERKCQDVEEIDRARAQAAHAKLLLRQTEDKLLRGEADKMAATLRVEAQITLIEQLRKELDTMTKEVQSTKTLSFQYYQTEHKLSQAISERDATESSLSQVICEKENREADFVRVISERDSALRDRLHWKTKADDLRQNHDEILEKYEALAQEHDAVTTDLRFRKEFERITGEGTLKGREFSPSGPGPSQSSSTGIDPRPQCLLLPISGSQNQRDLLTDLCPSSGQSTVLICPRLDDANFAKKVMLDLGRKVGFVCTKDDGPNSRPLSRLREESSTPTKQSRRSRTQLVDVLILASPSQCIPPHISIHKIRLIIHYPFVQSTHESTPSEVAHLPKVPVLCLVYGKDLVPFQEISQGYNIVEMTSVNQVFSTLSMSPSR